MAPKVRMMSRTGNRDGFSLLEVLVATVILSVGVVFLFPSFFMATDALGIVNDQLVVQPWAENKLWEDTQALAQARPAVAGLDAGEVQLEKKTYIWERSSEEVEPGLFALTLVVRWVAGGREHEMVFATYVPTPL